MLIYNAPTIWDEAGNAWDAGKGVAGEKNFRKEFGVRGNLLAILAVGRFQCA